MATATSTTLSASFAHPLATIPINTATFTTQTSLLPSLPIPTSFPDSPEHLFIAPFIYVESDASRLAPRLATRLFGENLLGHFNENFLEHFVEYFVKYFMPCLKVLGFAAIVAVLCYGMMVWAVVCGGEESGVENEERGGVGEREGKGVEGGQGTEEGEVKKKGGEE